MTQRDNTGRFTKPTGSRAQLETYMGDQHSVRDHSRRMYGGSPTVGEIMRGLERPSLMQSGPQRPRPAPHSQTPAVDLSDALAVERAWYERRTKAGQ